MRRVLGLAIAIGAALATACSGAPERRPTSARAAPPGLASSSSPRVALRDAGFAFRDPRRKEKIADALAAVDGIVSGEVARQGIPGAFVGVVVDGELAYAKGFGVTDLEERRPPDVDTVYRIGSITKSFTALTLLSLRDEGALSLDEPLARLVPEAGGLVYPGDAAPLTLRELLTHTAGLPRCLALSCVDLPHDPPASRVLAGLAGFALERPPGAKHVYSNLGFALLGIAESRASRGPYREAVRARVLAPLGMTSTFWEADDVPAGRLASPYERAAKGGVTKVRTWRIGAYEAGGGLFASARDVARYVAFQLSAYPARSEVERGPVRRSSVREAHRGYTAVRTTINPLAVSKKGDHLVWVSTARYGFGWESGATCNLDGLVWHGGSIDGFESALYLVPESGVGVFVLTNVRPCDADEIAHRVLQALGGRGALSKRVAEPTPALAAAVSRVLSLEVAWSDDVYAALISRSALRLGEAVHERATLAASRRRHGPCSRAEPVAVSSEREARYRLTCARGSLEVGLLLGEDDLLLHLTVTGESAVDADLAPGARAVAQLIGAWDDAVYDKHLSKSGGVREAAKRAFDGQRAAHGGCAVKGQRSTNAERVVRLSCDVGDLALTLTPDASAPAEVTSYHLTIPPSEELCPRR